MDLQYLEQRFWTRNFKELMTGILWNNNFSRIKINKDTYTMLEQIALWEVPNITSKVIRNDKQKIQKIQYYIGTRNVLTLFHKNTLNLETFFYDGYYYLLDEKTFKINFYNFLKAFPSFYFETEQKYKELAKEEKIKSIAQNNIHVMVSNLMEKHHYAYVLEAQENTCVLKIKMKKKQMIEISLPYKNFLHHIEKIIPSIELVKNILEQAELRVNIKGYGNHMNWKNDKQ